MYLMHRGYSTFIRLLKNITLARSEFIFQFQSKQTMFAYLLYYQFVEQSRYIFIGIDYGILYLWNCIYSMIIIIHFYSIPQHTLYRNRHKINTD